MTRKFSLLLALLTALTLTVSCFGTAAIAEAAEAPEVLDTAYIMYADSSWTNQYWLDGNEYAGVTATNADITGPGDYTVGLTFENEAQGLAFTALGIKTGEKTLPNHFIRINEIRVNGEPIEVAKGYTSSDDGVETRMNIYTEWVSELPADARSYDGYVDDADCIIVDKEDFASVKSVEIDFSLLKYGEDTAYIMYADGTWERQYWLDGNAYDGVAATNAEITGPGDYTVGLDFTGTGYGKAADLAFMALGIKHGENTYPGMMIEIRDIRVNGESIAFTKGYTSSDDGIETRMNIYNEWVPEVPVQDASVRSFDGVVEDASAQIVDKTLFAEVTTVEIDFTLHAVTDTAYIMFADSAWANQYWLDGNEYAGVTAKNATVEGPGTYTVGLEFENEAAGVAFAGLGIKTGEKTFPGYFIDIKEIKVNGEAIEVAKGYTSSDDSVETRMNVYNEWVPAVPTDDASVRSFDGSVDDAAPIIVDKDAFAAVKSIEITFDYIYGEPPAASTEPPYTEEEAAAVKAADYNAYIGLQSENYIFRNAWNDTSYGKDVEDGAYFNQLTGWDENNEAVSYGGTFADAAITKDGTYSVSVTTGEKGFGSDTVFHLLFVSTDIPSKAVKEGVITISDVTVKFGEGRTQEYGEINTDGEMLQIDILNDYQQSSEPVSYTMPGADTTITISFTVAGLTE